MRVVQHGTLLGDQEAESPGPLDWPVPRPRAQQGCRSLPGWLGAGYTASPGLPLPGALGAAIQAPRAASWLQGFAGVGWGGMGGGNGEGTHPGSLFTDLNEITKAFY